MSKLCLLYLVTALAFFIASVWLAIPMFTLRNFPHLTWRDYVAIGLMLMANACIDRWARLRKGGSHE
jgi:hypothetical protein